MTNQEIVNKLANVKKGVYTHLVYVSDLGNGVSRVTRMVVRLKINPNSNRVNDHTPPPLPWGDWMEGHKGEIIQHKDNYYLRVYSIKNSRVIRNSYLYEGNPISYSEAKELTKIRKGSQSEIFSLKVENILEFGN